MFLLDKRTLYKFRENGDMKENGGFYEDFFILGAQNKTLNNLYKAIL